MCNDGTDHFDDVCPGTPAFKVLTPAKPCASASDSTCAATNAKCSDVCKDHGFVANEECYGSSPTYVRCMCNDGTDHFDDVCPGIPAFKVLAPAKPCASASDSTCSATNAKCTDV